MKAWLVLVLVLAGGSAALALRGGGEPRPIFHGLSPVGLRLVQAQAFVLEEPYVHTWRAERPSVSSGWLLVLESEPALLVRRQHAERVLYAGAQTAERLNNGDGSGRVVVLVPSDLDASGRPVLDLAAVPLWLGSPALPEQVGALTVQHELDAARAAGLGPPSAVELGAALGASGGGAAPFVDRLELEGFAADLIAFHAPDESSLVEGLRVR